MYKHTSWSVHSLSPPQVSVRTSIPPGQCTLYLLPRSLCVQAYLLVSALTISSPGLCAYKHTSWSVHSLSPTQVSVRTSIPPGQRTHYLLPRSLCVQAYSWSVHSLSPPQVSVCTSIPPGQHTLYLLPRSLCTSIPPGQCTLYLLPRSLCVQAYLLVSALSISYPGLCAYKHTSWLAHSLSPSQVSVRTSIPPGQCTLYLLPRSLCVQAYLLVSALTISFPGLCAYKHTSWSVHSLSPPQVSVRTSIPPGQCTLYLLPRSLCVQAYLLVSTLSISSPGLCAYKHTSWSVHSLSPSQVSVCTSIPPGQHTLYLLPRSLCVQAYLLVSALSISSPGLCVYKHTSWSAHSLSPPQVSVRTSIPPGQCTLYLLPRSLCVQAYLLASALSISSHLLVSALSISSPDPCAYKHTSWSAHSLSPPQVSVRTSIPPGQCTLYLLPRSLCVQAYLLVSALSISSPGLCVYKHTSWSAHSLSPPQVSVRTSIPPGQCTLYLLPRSLCVQAYLLASALSISSHLLVSTLTIPYPGHCAYKHIYVSPDKWHTASNVLHMCRTSKDLRGEP